MLELTDAQVSFFAWETIILLVLVCGAATLDALPMYLINRETYAAVKDMPNREGEQIGALGDLRRSRNMLLGFATWFLLSLAAGAARFLVPPANEDKTISVVIFSHLILIGLFFFWRAKHADWTTAKRQARLADYESREANKQ